MKQLAIAGLCLFQLLLFTKVRAQESDADWREQVMHKYWFYRYRLINDFMIIGEGRGMSLVAEKRNNNGSQFNFPDANGHSYGSPQMDWGADATALLGWYLGVLATEYAVLNRYSNEKNSENLSQTVKETYYAIKALERLDRNAEKYLYPDFETSEKSLNGFFMRDDVPVDFICLPDSDGIILECEENYFRLNSVKTKDDNLNNYSFISNVRSETVRRSEKNNPDFDWQTRNIMSQDQVVTLFMGLSLVSKFFPSDVAYKGVYLKTAAQNNMLRIINYLSKNAWVIKFPSNEELPGFDFESQGENIKKVGAIGGNVGWNSTGLAETAIKWGNSSIKAPGALWKLQAEQVFAKGCNNDMTTLFAHETNYWMFMELIALSSAIEAFLNIDDNQTDVHHASERLLKTGACFNFEILPLLHEVLFDYRNISAENVNNDLNLLNLIRIAPCYGPHNFGPQDWTYIGTRERRSLTNEFSQYYIGDNGNIYGYNPGYDEYEWSSTCRFANQSRRGLDQKICTDDENICKGAYRYKGEYNGLDFMILYNLYMLKHPESLPRKGYYNALNPFLTKTYPYKSLGAIEEPLEIIGFEELTSNASIESGADITYLSPKITLSSGFTVKEGARFHIKAGKPYSCIYTRREYMPAENPDTDFSVPSDDESYFKVFPNPFINELNIDFLSEEPEHWLKCILLNSMGQKIRDFNFPLVSATFNQFKIPTADLIPGTYVLIGYTNKRLFKRVVVRQ